MNKLLIILFNSIVMFSFMSCSKEPVARRSLIGEDINEVKKEFESKGFYVSSIVDSTLEGKKLSMTIELKKASNLDSISYAADRDLTPWKNNAKNYLLVESDMAGKIINVK